MDVERVHQQSGFVIHQRPYKNTSMIVDVFTRDYGRISLVAKAVKQAKSSLKSILHPFQLLQVSWVRRSDLGTLTQAEIVSTPTEYLANRLYAAFYLNELLMRVLTPNDPATGVFSLYENALKNLLDAEKIEVILRIFEKDLLQTLGYEIQLIEEADTHQPISREKLYQFTPEYGFTSIDNTIESSSIVFQGDHLLAFHENNLMDAEVLRTAHRITYINLKRLLGDKPLKSRELLSAFRQIK